MNSLKMYIKVYPRPPQQLFHVKLCEPSSIFQNQAKTCSVLTIFCLHYHSIIFNRITLPKPRTMFTRILVQIERKKLLQGHQELHPQSSTARRTSWQTHFYDIRSYRRLAYNWGRYTRYVYHYQVYSSKMVSFVQLKLHTVRKINIDFI